MDEIPCWNCDGKMRRFGKDTFYWYYRCDTCGKEKAELREDRPKITIILEDKDA